MKVNTDRLKLLAYYLASVPTREFNIITWEKCSVGWASKVPEFAELGFRLVTTSTLSVIPAYNGYLGWLAVEAFFGLTYDQAAHLFSMFDYDGNVTPKRVVTRIKAFVKGK